jgi:hypothetical protein
VHGVGPKADVPYVADAARAVVPFEIALQHQPIVPQHDQPMQIPDAFVGNGVVEPRLEIGREACVRGRDRCPILRHGEQSPGPG